MLIMVDRWLPCLPLLLPLFVSLPCCHACSPMHPSSPPCFPSTPAFPPPLIALHIDPISVVAAGLFALHLLSDEEHGRCNVCFWEVHSVRDGREGVPRPALSSYIRVPVKYLLCTGGPILLGSLRIDWEGSWGWGWSQETKPHSGRGMIFNTTGRARE